VRFWDTSALVPLLLAEPLSLRAKSWLREDPNVIVWTLIRVEILSALARRRRSEPRAARHLAAARRELLETWKRRTEIVAVEVVRRHAERLVERHPLRAADALQLAAAIVAADGQPATLTFVTLDEHQAAAAEREGFQILRA
jgi:uncharacterized protein